MRPREFAVGCAAVIFASLCVGQASARAQPAPAPEPLWSFEPAATAHSAGCSLLGALAGCVGHPAHGIAALVSAYQWDADPPVAPLLPTPTLVEWARTTPGALADGLGVGLAGRSRYELRFVLDGFDMTDVDWSSRTPRIPLAFLSSAIAVRGGVDARHRAASLIAAELLEPGRAVTAELSLYAPSQVAVRAEKELEQGVIRWQPALRTGYAVGVVRGPLWSDRVGGVFGLAADLSWGRGRRTIFALADEDGDGKPDRGANGERLREPLEVRRVAESWLTVPYLARLVVSPLAGHTLAFSIVGHEQRTTELSRLAATLSAGRLAYRNHDTAAFATYHAALPAGLSLALGGGIHRVTEDHRAVLPADRDRPQQLSAALGAVDAGDESAVVRERCSDGDGDLYPRIINCPVGGSFVSGGQGYLHDELEERRSTRASVSWEGEAAGIHQAEVGFRYEERRLESLRGFSGARYLIGSAEYRYIELGEGPETCGTLDPQPCTYLDAVSLVSRSRFIGGYLSERYAPTPALRLDLGLRLDRQNLQDRLRPGLEFGPRLALAFDPGQDGRARLFAGYGRYAQDLVLRTADTGFARVSRMATVQTPLGEGQATETITPVPVDPEIAPGYSDEVVVGAEWHVAEAFEVALVHQHHWVGRVIEDVVRGGERLITNPGAARGEDGPRRVIDATTATLSSAASGALSLDAHYTLAFVRGNHSGPVGGPRDLRSPALQLAFDSGEFMANADGPLPADRRHTLRVSARYRTAVSSFSLAVSPQFVLASGAPLSAMATQLDEGSAALFLLPRGGAGREPLAHRVDLGVVARRRVTGGELELFAEIFNLIAVRGNGARGEIYTDDATAPIVGGTLEDLVFAKRVDGFGEPTSLPLRRREDFGEPVGAPRVWLARLGLRFRY